MTTAAAFIKRLDLLGVELEASGERLRCNAPKGVLTSELRAELAERKEELLGLLRRDGAHPGGNDGGRRSAGNSLTTKTTDASSSARLVRVSREQRLPLSFAQQRLLFLDQLEPGNPFYNLPEAVRLRNPLNVAALEQTLGEIQRRHEVLRTTFPVVEGQPEQVIAPAESLRLRVVDLRHLPEATREAAGHRLARLEARRPFDLARGPLMRASLIRLDSDNHFLLLNMHHIVSDGWSTGVIVGETMTLYKALSDGRPSPLPEYQIQYADFAYWQQQVFQGEALDGQVAYWKRQLAGASPVLELPADRPRPPVQTFRGANLALVIPADLSKLLRALSRREGVTLFVTLLTAFQILLHRYTGQDDINTGSPIAGRNRLETEGLIGLFMNTLVLRVNLGGNPRFGELLRRVREVVIGAHAHQDLPFEKLVEELQPRRELNRNPLFQVMFRFQNAPVQNQQPSGLAIYPLEVESGRSLFDLMLTITEGAEELSGSIEYSTDLFDETTMRRFQRHFLTLLESIAAHPEKRLGELSLLTGDERVELIVERNRTASRYDRDACVHQLFEAQAARTPHAIALVCGEEHLTYGELNRSANRLARRLAGSGVGAGALVGIMLERGAGMLVGALAIMKAGGAYVPLDPSFPRERLAFMLRDSQAPVLLTESSLAGAMPEHDARVIYLDDEREALTAESAENPEREATAEHPAYVIYTSGSTGKPKGVRISHRAVVNFLTSMSLRPGLTSRDTLLAVTTLSFDIAGLELYLPLIKGARILLATGEMAADGARLLDATAGATIMQATPATWRLMLEAGWRPGQSRHLRMLCGGEALPRELADQLLDRGAELWNMYGPTETTIWSAACRVKRDSRAVTIGQPIANTQIYVPDRYLNQSPEGIYGELLIGGDGLADGYLNHPALTAERFIPNPFGAKPGARVYRTGDLVRYLEDGQLEFVGRADHQVKVRGFRIELGEIETALAEHPALGEVVAVAQQSEAGEQRLAAYLIAGEASLRPSSTELRAFLRERLPDYMIPAFFVFLESWPLTPNGKIDRNALPSPQQHDPGAEAGLALAVNTPVEEMLADIWCEVLERARVGVSDHFFEIGGHSLSAAQVISRIRAAFGVDIPLRSIFQRPTLGELARTIEEALSAGAGVNAPPLTTRRTRGASPLSFAQQRLWFLDQLRPDSAQYNIPTVMRLDGTLSVNLLEQSINEVVRRHASLGTRFAVEEAEPVQIVDEGVRVALPLADLRGLGEDAREVEARRLVGSELEAVFDLARAPLLRARLLRLGESEHIVVLVMHHIIGDGWSMGIFVEEVATLYRAFAAGLPSPLADLNLRYSDYAAWQREWLQGEGLDAQLSYWRGQLKGAPPLLQLPTDYPRPSRQSFRGAAQTRQLGSELTGRLKELSRKEGATLFMTLMAAFNLLLQRYTRQDDIVIGTNTAKRTRGDIEGIIGLFVDNLVLRTDISGDPSFRTLLARVRETCLEAYAHQDLPFDKIVEELQPARDLSYNPLFQVLFVLQNNPSPSLEVPGLTLRRQEFDISTVQFDLVVDVYDAKPELLIKLRYSTDLFDKLTIVQMLKQFETLLEGICRDPGQKVGHISLGQSEARQLVCAFNDDLN
ncbi:MAG TPA: amino acid adenylation domain-containing protein [Pyrinomonadaceae bacterium]